MAILEVELLSCEHDLKNSVQVVLLLSFLQKSEPVAIITQYLQATFMHQVQWFCKLFLLILSVSVRDIFNQS